jgi:hypothetical protein
MATNSERCSRARKLKENIKTGNNKQKIFNSEIND